MTMMVMVMTRTNPTTSLHVGKILARRSAAKERVSQGGGSDDGSWLVFLKRCQLLTAAVLFDDDHEDPEQMIREMGEHLLMERVQDALYQLSTARPTCMLSLTAIQKSASR
jgi:hypothetical protein